MIEFAQAVICFAEKFVPVIEKVFPFLEKFFPNIGKVNLKISNVEMNLDIPRESDGEGGFIHGSRGSFSVEIINKKGITVILEDFYCIAYCGDSIIQDDIHCKDKATYRKIAMRPTYDDVSSFSIPAKEMRHLDIVINSNKDLSQCNKVALTYLQGKKRRKVTVYDRLEGKCE